MKKYNKLFAILFAVLGVTTLKAQTDVTDQYLVNADFEGSYESVYEIKNDGRYIYKPEGWTVDYVNKSTWNMTVVGSTDTNAASTFKDTYAIPADNNRYMVRFRDNQPTEYVDLSQTITIKESGSYTFSADLIREDGSKVDVSLYVGETSVSNASPGVWENRSFTIALSAGDVVKVGLKFRNIAAGGNKLGADNVKIAFEPINTSEQSWIAPIVGVNLADVTSDTELYMYNVKADAFASSGMSWGTHAIVKELQNGDSKLSADVHRCRVSKPTDGQLQIMLNEKSFLGGGGPTSTNDCWVDHGSNNIYIYNEVSTNVYTLKPTTATTDSYLDCSWKYGGHITFSATNGYGNTEWAFVLRSDITSGKYLLYKAKKEMYDIYAAVKEAGHDDTYAEALAIANVAYNDANATAATVNAATKVLLANVAPALTSDYFSANSLFKNPDMRGYGDDTDWGNGLNAFGDGIFESWHSSETITQKQTGLPNGFYTVEFIGIYRQDGGDAAPTLTLTSGSNSAKANLKALTEIDFGNCSGGNKWTGANKPDDKYTAGEALAHTDANVKVENFFVENGELTVTVAMPSGSQWLLCQGFRISYKAESLEQYANLFYAAKSAAEAIDQNTLNIYAKNTLTTALNNAATEQIDKAWYQEHTAALNNAVTIANDIATTYPKTSALLTICNDILDNSVEFEDGAKETFSGIVSTASENVAIAQTSAAINDIYNTLEAARQTYVQKADPINDIHFDYTFLIVNPSFETGNTDGWITSSGGDTGAKLNSNGTYTINGADGEFVFNTWGADNMRVEQTLKGIPTGIYTLKAIVASDANSVIKLTAGNETKEITITTNKSTATEGVVETSYSSGDFLIKAASTSWFKADHFRLYYYGFDIETAQEGVTNSKAEAEGLVGKPMNADVKLDLETAINGADATKTTRNELNSMIAALDKAIDEAETSIAEYEKIATYIAKANTIDESIAADVQTQYDNGSLDKAKPVFQALEVATYNYVKSEFSYPVALSSDWNTEGPVGELSDQHWSGEKKPYMEQSNTAYGQNEWTIKYDQDLTLPAGEYVFKVAGRKASGNGCTLSLTVTNGEEVLGTVNDFPEGDTGYGIDMSGAANFSDEGTYANGDKGRGWQWRYVRFKLTQNATVNIAVNAGATTKSQWISFCDATLQMTEETYLEANKGGLVAPTAAAEALVDTKPMGAAENTALQAALDMPVTTGAELQAKINALNTAVANANTWVAAYNEAKAPLVAALERFEADYNDAENGALDYMCKSRWATAVNMAQAAAVAKDVTDSYEGFAIATENLVAALDAATVSVGEYANLKAAIETAGPLYNGGNWGDKPFQRPISAKESLNTTTAQATYDEAEADGEDVTSVTAALNENIEAVDAIVLNAPAKGTKYNMVMDYAGWEHHGKAVTYLAGGRNDAGLYNIQYYAASNANYAQAFTFTAVEGKANCYTLSMTDVDGNERYVCTGVAYGGNTSQIRTTTDATQALAVKVIATTTDGIHQLYNTEANNYIGGQDAGFYTVNSHTTFRLKEAEKANVTLTLSEVGWATLILPFNATLPEGVKAWSCGEADGETLNLVEEVESLKANTPYLMSGKAGTYNFSGYGLADKDSYTDGLFTGTYVDYKTTANGKTYVLQNHDGDVAFYLVGDLDGDGNYAAPTVKPYRIYMTYEALAGEAAAPMFRIGRGATGIEDAEWTMDNGQWTIYDLMGRKVTTMEKGNMYIVNGKKVVIK